MVKIDKIKESVRIGGTTALKALKDLQMKQHARKKGKYEITEVSEGNHLSDDAEEVMENIEEDKTFDSARD